MFGEPEDLDDTASSQASPIYVIADELRALVAEIVGS